MINMQFAGLEAMLARIDQAGANIANSTDLAVQMGGIVCEATAKKKSPVKTGRLRAGNQYRKMGTARCVVINTVNYAAPVERGHRAKNGRFVAPRPFMLPGYLAGKAEIKRDLAKIPGVKIKSWS